MVYSILNIMVQLQWLCSELGEQLFGNFNLLGKL